MLCRLPKQSLDIEWHYFTTELVEPTCNHNEEDEYLIQSVIDWVGQCEPGEEWQMPQDWLPDSDELAKLRILVFVNDSPT